MPAAVGRVNRSRRARNGFRNQLGDALMVDVGGNRSVTATTNFVGRKAAADRKTLDLRRKPAGMPLASAEVSSPV